MLFWESNSRALSSGYRRARLLFALALVGKAGASNSCTPASSLAPSEQAETFETSLLQMRLQVRSGEQLANAEPVFPMYGLSPHHIGSVDGTYELNRTANGCALNVPKGMLSVGLFGAGNESSGLDQWSFAWGECPEVLSSPVMTKLDLGRHHMDAPMPKGNPSLINLPENLRDVFPKGRFLAVAASSPYLNVLDGDFVTVNRTLLQMHDLDLWNTCPGQWLMSGDPRIFLTNNGEIIIGFIPYCMEWSDWNWNATQPQKSEAYYDDWWFHEVFGRVHLSVDLDGGELTAFVKRRELRSLHHCPEKGLESEWTHKNMAFMQKPGDDKLYLQDWIYPTRVGRLDPSDPPEAKFDNLTVFYWQCFGYEPEAAPLVEDPFGMIAGAPEHPFGTAGLVWIEETQQFLGVGHLHRGWIDPRNDTSSLWSNTAATSHGSHYSHMFYTFSGEPPFRLTALSTEFCFASIQDPSDCEALQFGSGLVRDGADLIVAWGVMDVKAVAMRLNLTDVLARLRPVH